MSDHITKPFFLLQHNWYKMMEYFQNDMLSYYTKNLPYNFYKVSLQYVADNEESKARLNFHLTQSEKTNIAFALNSEYNKKSLLQVQQYFIQKDSVQIKKGE
jgi:hypothetical protein